MPHSQAANSHHAFAVDQIAALSDWAAFPQAPTCAPPTATGASLAGAALGEESATMTEAFGLGGHVRAIDWPGCQGARSRARSGAACSIDLSSSRKSSVAQDAPAIGVHSAIGALCRAIVFFAFQLRE
jgi:hypothetical protein